MVGDFFAENALYDVGLRSELGRSFLRASYTSPGNLSRECIAQATLLTWRSAEDASANNQVEFRHVCYRVKPDR